jgi:4-amino-4-deoxy-L-arabinose transferase-like glycosyltransferase
VSLPGRLLRTRELVIWAALYLVFATLLVVTRFASDDPDSALYANLSERLAELPPSYWIAPQWWGYWDSEGLFREHPAGVFLLPTALAQVGLPAIQGSYVVGTAAGLGSLLLLGLLVSRVTSGADGRASLILLQLMPVAFLFRIRANHEYPMLLCTLLVLAGLDGVRRSWWWAAVVAVAFTAALLVKAVFVVLIVMAAVLWIAINPTRATGSVARPIAAMAVAGALMAMTAVAYDAAYFRVTGEAFWGPYWRRQLGPLTIATPLENASTLVSHVWFYITRLLWHAVPWSITLAVVIWQWRGRLRSIWQATPEPARRGVIFAALFIGLAIVMLSPASRFAERYAFSATYALGTLGAVVAWHAWPRLARAIGTVDRAVPAFPAVLWFALMIGRLMIGPFLPRIT